MKTRRPLAILAATAVAGLGLTALATPASANTQVTVSQTAPNSADDPGFSESSIIDTRFTLTNDESGTFYVLVSAFIRDASGANCATPTGNQCKVNADIGDNTGTFDIIQGANNAQVKWTNSNGGETGTAFTVTSTVQPGPDPDPDPESTSSSTPAPRIQQFEKPATGTCDEAQPEGLNWGGASSGGWGESWAQWMHEGQGGAVCTRTLAFNTSTATWQVQ